MAEKPCEKKNPKPKSDAKDKKKKDAKGRVKCPLCTKTYSKKSNMNAHVKIKHRLNRWVCPQAECNRMCATKASLQRHVERKHTRQNILTKHRKGSRKRSRKQMENQLDFNECEYFGADELSDAAKTAKIRRLEQELQREKDKTKSLEENLLQLKQENEQLKAGK